jgi:hypothetical protein
LVLQTDRAHFFWRMTGSPDRSLCWRGMRGGGILGEHR